MILGYLIDMIWDILFAIVAATFIALIDYRRTLIREREDDDEQREVH